MPLNIGSVKLTPISKKRKVIISTSTQVSGNMYRPNCVGQNLDYINTFSSFIVINCYYLVAITV